MFQSKPRTLFSPFLSLFFLFFFLLISFASKIKHHHNHHHLHDESLTYLWPLPSQFTSGNHSLSVDPSLTVSVIGNGGVGDFSILNSAFDRYKEIIFKHTGYGFSKGLVRKLRERIGVIPSYHIVTLNIIVHSNIEEVILFDFVLINFVSFWFFISGFLMVGILVELGFFMVFPFWILIC
jgi:hexosaminidase